MPEVSQPAKVFGPAEIARDWAARGHKVSRQYVDKLIRVGVQGAKLPTDSLEAAWSFRTLRTKICAPQTGGGAVSAGPGGAVPAGAPPGAPPRVPPRVPPRDDDTPALAASLEDELERVKSLVAAAFRNWERALVAKPYDAFNVASAAKAYRDAMDTRVDVEGLIETSRKKAGLSVNLLDGDRMISDRLGGFRSALHGLDREIAKEFCPEDPAKARPRARRVIARVMLPAIARAKRPFISPAHGRNLVAA